VVAESLDVQFDCGAVVPCQEISSETSLAPHPRQKIIEAVVQVSVRIIAGQAEDVSELLFEIHSPGRRARVVDFEPKTVLESELTEPIKITRTAERQRSFGVGLGGGVAVPVGPTHVEAAPTANVGTSRREVVTKSIKRVAPKRAIVIAGTTHRQHGVFYKLRPSTQRTLEGVHELTCRFAVPDDWRGDWLLLSCRAEGIQTRYFVKSNVTCGDARYVLALHVAGDDDAREAAEHLADAQAVTSKAGREEKTATKDRDRAAQLREASAALARLAGTDADAGADSDD
jgi:hypothetical protein